MFFMVTAYLLNLLWLQVGQHTVPAARAGYNWACSHLHLYANYSSLVCMALSAGLLLLGQAQLQ